MAGNAENPASGASSESRLTLPVYQETLQIRTETVDAGAGVRVHKSVTEQPYRIDEQLLHDEIVVEHVLVDKIISLAEAPTVRYEGDTLIVPILEEILVVERRLRIKEEIHIIKKKCEKRHSETVILKSEQVSIEHFDDAQEMQKK